MRRARELSVQAAFCATLAMVPACGGSALRLSSPAAAVPTHVRAEPRPDASPSAVARVPIDEVVIEPAEVAVPATGPVRLRPVQIAHAPPTRSSVRYGEVPSTPLPSYVERVATGSTCRTLFGTGPRYDVSARCTGGQGAQVFTVPQFWTPADPSPSP